MRTVLCAYDVWTLRRGDRIGAGCPVEICDVADERLCVADGVRSPRAIIDLPMIVDGDTRYIALAHLPDGLEITVDGPPSLIETGHAGIEI